MSKIFRPSHAFPPADDNVSVLHDTINNQLTQHLRKIADEVWAKFGGYTTTTQEEQEAFRASYREKVDKLYPPRRIIQSFEIVAIRKE